MAGQASRQRSDCIVLHELTLAGSERVDITACGLNGNYCSIDNTVAQLCTGQQKRNAFLHVQLLGGCYVRWLEKVGPHDPPRYRRTTAYVLAVWCYRRAHGWSMLLRSYWVSLPKHIGERKYSFQTRNTPPCPCAQPQTRQTRRRKRKYLENSNWFQSAAS